MTETYYETEYRTEYRTESYTEAGEEQWERLTPDLWWYEPIYFKVEGGGKEMNGIIYDGYKINTAGHLNSRIKIVLGSPSGSTWMIRAYNLTGVGQIKSLGWRFGVTSSGESQQGGYYKKGTTEYVSPPDDQAWLDNFNAIITDPKRSLAFARWDSPPGEIIFDATGVE